MINTKQAIIVHVQYSLILLGIMAHYGLRKHKQTQSLGIEFRNL